MSFTVLHGTHNRSAGEPPEPPEDPTEHGDYTGLLDDDHTQYVRNDLADAKGDILVASANDTVIRVAAGSNGARLIADDTQTAGVRWR